jgi:RNA polymerase sigma-70 factor, ECF subfamily
MRPADAASFAPVRPRLFGIAYRFLGSATDADDVVQDTWIRWQRADRSDVRDAPAFLAATTTRVAINVIQSARSRHEAHLPPELADTVDLTADPVRDAERVEAVELGLRRLLEKLSPIERAAYVLREAFDYPYREIARAIAVSEVNARQLVSRARRRLDERGGRPARAADLRRLRDGFLAAAQDGHLAALEQLLTSDVLGGSDVRVAA